MFMRIDVPEASGLSGWLDELGLVQTGRAKTLSMGSIPKRSGHLRAFALANQALG
jgi:hypothetical protein